jgi:hypothetical protein
LNPGLVEQDLLVRVGLPVAHALRREDWRARVEQRHPGRLVDELAVELRPHPGRTFRVGGEQIQRPRGVRVDPRSQNRAGLLEYRQPKVSICCDPYCVPNQPMMPLCGRVFGSKMVRKYTSMSFIRCRPSS